MKLKFIFLFLVLTSMMTTINCNYSISEYLDFISSDATATRYHKQKICWKATDHTGAAKDPSVVWFYDIKRDIGAGTEVGSNNNNAIYDRYSVYMLKKDGTNNLDYVAWDIVVNCASQVTCVQYNIKFFKCTDKASEFIGKVVSDKKIRFKADGKIFADGTIGLTIPLQNYLGANYDFIAECS